MEKIQIWDKHTGSATLPLRTVSERKREISDGKNSKNSEWKGPYLSRIQVQVCQPRGPVLRELVAGIRFLRR